MNIFKYTMVLMALVLFFISGISNAACVAQNGGLPVREITLGSSNNLTVYKLEFQQAGTQLFMETFTNSQIASLLGRTLETTIYQCDLADADKIYEIYNLPYNAVPVAPGNMYPMFMSDDINYWAVQAPSLSFQMFIGMGKSASTQFNNQVIKKTIAYEVDTNNANKINIKIKHFSGVTLVQARSNVDVAANSGLSIAGFRRGYIGFSGPNINTSLNNTSFPGSNYLPIALRQIRGNVVATCGLQYVNNTVNLGRVAPADVATMTPVPFSFTLKCQQNASIKYGFAPGQENLAANQTDFLLLDPNLGSTAKGVAIEILNSTNGRHKLLNSGDISNSGGASNNWVSVNTSGSTSTVERTLNFSARYVPYGGVPITPGKANSKMTIMLNTN